MSIQDLKTTISSLNEEDFFDLFGWVCGDEYDRRKAAPAVEKARAEDAKELWETHPELKPQFATEVEPETSIDQLVAKVAAWAKPASRATAYPPAALVSHDGKLWRNRRLGQNANTPGEIFSGWQDVTRDFLRDEPINTEGEDAPGLITEPDEPHTPDEPVKPVEPAPTVPEWKPGELITAGTTRLYNGALYVCQRLHTTRDDRRPDTATDYWTKLS